MRGRALALALSPSSSSRTTTSLGGPENDSTLSSRASRFDGSGARWCGPCRGRDEADGDRRPERLNLTQEQRGARGQELEGRLVRDPGSRSLAGSQFPPDRAHECAEQNDDYTV